ncbi:GATA zinc finger domain-containing protein 14-like [Eupeodes corollae]|uniref:GATA zinc finger domain-containing protein 14-like n=1 Tax=Eupeodes corollae TaxID=290404 RepID=UPI002491EC69|nr:GATA zinc finger domain-containing protein 14-like [Eupeodes corollae]
MWTFKILLVMMSISILAIQAEISGLQNNINNGYSYDRPEAVPAELAYYQKIPAGGGTFAANNLRHIDQHQQQHFHGGNAQSFGQNHHSHYNQHSIHDLVSQSISENHGESFNSHQHHNHQFNEPSTVNQYIPPEPVPNLPFIQENSGFRPINSPHQYEDLPFIRENTGLRLVNSPPHPFSNHHQHQQEHQHTFGANQQNFQAVLRNHQNEIPQNTINFLQRHQNQNSPSPSEKLQPPPSFNAQSASSVNPSATHPQQPNNRFMASIIGSVNVPLPFPLGTVPIKFEPLPLKTHLRQERLLPITSYEAKEFYTKK